MNINLILGVAAIGYGLFTAVARVKNPQAFEKLEAMRKQWGHGVGTTIHVIGYTVAPLLVGIALVYRAVTGQ